MHKSSTQYEILVACLLHSFYLNFKGFSYYPFTDYKSNSTYINYIAYLTAITASGVRHA